MARQILRTKDFVVDSANFIFDQACQAIDERNQFRIALGGGNTPRPVYARLATRAHDLPWAKTQITFGDERCVPPRRSAEQFLNGE